MYRRADASADSAETAEGYLGQRLRLPTCCMLHIAAVFFTMQNPRFLHDRAAWAGGGLPPPIRVRPTPVTKAKVRESGAPGMDVLKPQLRRTSEVRYHSDLAPGGGSLSSKGFGGSGGNSTRVRISLGAPNDRLHAVARRHDFPDFPSNPPPRIPDISDPSQAPFVLCQAGPD